MLHLVLYNPEIPQNTGNIMRTCAGTYTKLHLIEPLGFKLDEKYLNRSTAGYYHETDFFVYKNWEEFISKNKGEMYFLTRYGTKKPSEFDLSDTQKDIYLVLGAESSGIPKEILKDHLDNCMRLPMNDKIRSLNLSNVAAILVYEALRQQDYPNLYTHEPETLKGKDFLLK